MNQDGHDRTATRTPKKNYAKSSFRVADMKMRFETGEVRALTFTSVISVDIFFLLWRFDPIPGYGLPFQGFAITLRHTTYSVELRWTSDQPVAETSTQTHNTHKMQTFILPQ